MRESCLDCVRKHIAQSAILMAEAELGYQLHREYAIGNLAEAEAESLTDFPELAMCIREIRVLYMALSRVDIGFFHDGNHAEAIGELSQDAIDNMRVFPELCSEILNLRHQFVECSNELRQGFASLLKTLLETVVKLGNDALEAKYGSTVFVNVDNTGNISVILNDVEKYKNDAL